MLIVETGKRGEELKGFQERTINPNIFSMTSF